MKRLLICATLLISSSAYADSFYIKSSVPDLVHLTKSDYIGYLKAIDFSKNRRMATIRDYYVHYYSLVTPVTTVYNANDTVSDCVKFEDQPSLVDASPQNKQYAIEADKRMSEIMKGEKITGVVSTGCPAKTITIRRPNINQFLYDDEAMFLPAPPPSNNKGLNEYDGSWWVLPKLNFDGSVFLYLPGISSNINDIWISLGGNGNPYISYDGSHGYYQSHSLNQFWWTSSRGNTGQHNENSIEVGWEKFQGEPGPMLETFATNTGWGIWDGGICKNLVVYSNAVIQPCASIMTNVNYIFTTAKHVYPYCPQNIKNCYVVAIAKNDANGNQTSNFDHIGYFAIKGADMFDKPLIWLQGGAEVVLDKNTRTTIQMTGTMYRLGANFGLPSQYIANTKSYGIQQDSPFSGAYNANGSITFTGQMYR
jgi:hypothetical protein